MQEIQREEQELLKLIEEKKQDPSRIDKQEVPIAKLKQQNRDEFFLLVKKDPNVSE